AEGGKAPDGGVAGLRRRRLRKETVLQEKRRNEGERSSFFLSRKDHEDHKEEVPFDWAAEGSLPRCTKAQIQTALPTISGLYLCFRTSRLSARCARRPIERHPPFVLRF